ncbi:hypothetical protein O181_062757 [Austropuccinia psidii MF-1]|uniref:Uncharacterized protein n=1 Tax=Austropuccinia psidii MF-1 TaxID=1389203 RepID=A0A9Q3EN90_9BASI|nr:hypothetical protein [Austropuccinia psidii MF-1]
MAFGPYPISLASHSPRPYSALIALLGQLSTSQTPRRIPLFLGLGGPVSLLWAFGRSSHHQASHGVYHPWGIINPLWGPLGPFGLSPMRPKGAKGASQLPPRSVGPILWHDPLETPENHVLASNPRGPKMTIGEFSLQDFSHGLRQLPEDPVTFRKGFPSI